MNSPIFDYVTERIISRLESGDIPWKRPWSINGFPKNLISGKEYRGINLLLLNCGHAEPFYLTYNQAKAAGCAIKTGQPRYMVVFWKALTAQKETDSEVDVDTISELDKPRYVLRYYYVYHYGAVPDVDQPKLAKYLDKLQVKETLDFNPIDKAETIASNMPLPPKRESGGGKACYNSMTDTVSMPETKYFVSNESYYYETLFHELAHSTGHESRLDRFTKEQNDHSFGSQSYSKEELVAEFAASFLCAKSGILDRTLDNNAAYIQSWIKALKNDKRMLIYAAAQAHKAADFILAEHVNPTGTDDTTVKDAALAASTPEPEPVPLPTPEPTPEPKTSKANLALGVVTVRTFESQAFEIAKELKVSDLISLNGLYIKAKYFKKIMATFKGVDFKLTVGLNAATITINHRKGLITLQASSICGQGIKAYQLTKYRKLEIV